MTSVRIYRPARTATQSGRRKTRRWRLEFVPGARKSVESLMGWTSAGTEGQVHLDFPDREAAEAFARRHGLAYDVEEPRESAPPSRTYAENFRPDRRE